MRRIRLKLVDRLELVEARFGAREAQVRGPLHQTELGVDVLELLVVGQGVPGQRGQRLLGLPVV